MSKVDLAQILDRDALDTSKGPQARLRIHVARAWVGQGGELEINAPTRISCARCDGGGCDGCDRSGAFRILLEPSERAIRLPLPSQLDQGMTLRVMHPFGEDGPVEQLLVELTVKGDEPSAFVTWIQPQKQTPRRPTLRAVLLVVMVIVLVLVAVLLSAHATTL